METMAESLLMDETEARLPLMMQMKDRPWNSCQPCLWDCAC